MSKLEKDWNLVLQYYAFIVIDIYAKLRKLIFNTENVLI